MARLIKAIVANKLRSGIVVAASLVALVGSFALSRALKFELMPPTDSGKVQILAELPLGSGIGETARVLGEIESHLKDYKEVSSILTDLGYQSDLDKDVNLARMDVLLVPKTRRAMSNNAIAASFTEKLSDIPGVAIRVTPISEINIGGQELAHQFLPPGQGQRRPAGADAPDHFGHGPGAGPCQYRCKRPAWKDRAHFRTGPKAHLGRRTDRAGDCPFAPRRR